MDHLPVDYRDKTIFEFIKVASDLTVHVSVKYVSDSRPETWPGSNKTYPRYKNQPKTAMRTGTGMVSKVQTRRLKENDVLICPCGKCSFKSKTPQTRFALIYIMTAAHVVFDLKESLNTTCHLFFDRGGVPSTCSGVITLRGKTYAMTKVEWDMTEVVYATHDMDLAERLGKMVGKYHQLQKITGRLIESNYTSRDKDYSLTVIISHPHGCSKQISIGNCTMTHFTDDLIQRIYTTPTCPGSSGAHVFVLGEDWLSPKHNHLHMGSSEGSGNLNCSGFNYIQQPYFMSGRDRSSVASLH